MGKKKLGNKIAKKRVEVKITYPEVEIRCPECNGYGGHDIAQICPVCNDRCTIIVRKRKISKRRR